jgi:hypothetical protein
MKKFEMQILNKYFFCQVFIWMLKIWNDLKAATFAKACGMINFLLLKMVLTFQCSRMQKISEVFRRQPQTFQINFHCKMSVKFSHKFYAFMLLQFQYHGNFCDVKNLNIQSAYSTFENI